MNVISEKTSGETLKQPCQICLGINKHLLGCPTIPGSNRSYFDAGQEMAQEHAPHFLSEKNLKKYDRSFALGYENARDKIKAKILISAS